MSHNPGTNSQAPITESRRAQRHAIEFRCKSAGERKKILDNAAAAGCELSEYLRAAALNQKPQRRPDATGDRRGLIEALGQLGKIGSNINQLAHAHNAGHLLTSLAIETALQELERCGAAIREALTNDRP